MDFCTQGRISEAIKRIKSKGSEFTKLTEQFYTFKIWCLQIMAPLTVLLEARIWIQVSWVNISTESSSPRIVTFKAAVTGTSIVLQWLGLCISSSGGSGWIPDQGTKIPPALQCGQNK